jgi:hypothetical protein
MCAIVSTGTSSQRKTVDKKRRSQRRKIWDEMKWQEIYGHRSLGEIQAVLGLARYEKERTH